MGVSLGCIALLILWKQQISSDDDFIPQERVTKQYSSSIDIRFTHNKTAKVVITEMLPDNYDHEFLEIFKHDHTGSYHCNFRIRGRCEEMGHWLQWKTKETMVFERSKTKWKEGGQKALLALSTQPKTGRKTQKVHSKNYTNTIISILTAQCRGQ